MRDKIGEWLDKLNNFRVSVKGREWLDKVTMFLTVAFAIVWFGGLIGIWIAIILD